MGGIFASKERGKEKTQKAWEEYPTAQRGQTLLPLHAALRGLQGKDRTGASHYFRTGKPRHIRGTWIESESMHRTAP